jgi:hypothetical protein
MSDNTSAHGPKVESARIEFLTNEPVEPSQVDADTPSGGARRDRTDDLLLAKQALSQLSYGPCQRSVISDQ